MNSLFISILIFVVIYFLVVYFLFSRNQCRNKIMKKVKKIYTILENGNFFKKIKRIILILEKEKVINKKIKIITPITIIMISIMLFIISYILIYQLFKVKSTTLILSVPIFFTPYFIIKYLLNKQKNKILINLPTYIINLKNNVSASGDIIAAIERTSTTKPFKIYIDEFNVLVKRGVNIYEAFDKLKSNIGIKKVSSFITACQMCYLNGGDFTGILERFSSIITKENIQKEKLKESSYSSIITLIVMFTMNIYLIFAFVFKNKEYADIIRNTFFGGVILNFTAITYIVIGYLILKIYRIGEE